MAYPTRRSVADLLNEARSALPQELVSASRFAQLQALAHFLPPSILVGLECRLGAADEAIDLWICPGLTPGDLQPTAAWLRERGWREFAPLARSLRRGEVPWDCALGAWTTEFDLAGWDKRTAPPRPSSFVTFGTAKERHPIVPALERLWRGERGRNMPRAQREQLQRLLCQCPQGELAGWGFLYPRPGQPGRLMLRIKELPDLAALLGDKLEIALKLLDGLTWQVVIGTPLYYRDERRQSLEAYVRGEANWQELTRRMVAQGYCSPNKAEALMQLTTQTSNTQGTTVTLNHVKLALPAQDPAQVKAYPSIF